MRGVKNGNEVGVKEQWKSKEVTQSEMVDPTMKVSVESVCLD